MTDCDRISALLERAGYPLKLEVNVPQPTQTEPVIHETLEDCIEAIVRDRTIAYNVTIDALVNALEKTLNEREQLMRDLEYVENKRGSCELCANTPFEAPDCYGCARDNNHWKWRGIPDKEGTP